jgi:4-hydroxyphenylacetate 3-monooxygenase
MVEAAVRSNSPKFLKTGEDYINAQRDGRVVYYRGKQIDVTEHPATAGGIKTIARLYDQQFDPAYRDILTYERPEDGERATISFMIPRTKEDLRRRRLAIEHISRETFGFYGRGIDMIAMVLVGMCGTHSIFKKHSPEFADNILTYRKYCEENNIHLAEVVAEPQGVRGRAAGTRVDSDFPNRAVAKVVKQTVEGVWISGVKVVSTAGPQANEIILGRVYPTGVDAECFWLTVPTNAPGLRQICREATSDAGDPMHHPITGHGEEMDGLLALDNVFVPNHRIFSSQVKELHDPNFFNTFARLEHWYTLTRIAVRAEMYAALGQMLIETLDLLEIPAVRQRIANLFQTAQILRGMVIASEELAEPTIDGVIAPHSITVTAARAYALETLPESLCILQDTAGQGLMTRMTDEDLNIECAFGKNMAFFLDQKNVSARDKTRLMNLIWDVTCSGTALRAKLFEVANAQNLPFLKERLYREYDSSRMAAHLSGLLGIGPTAPAETPEYSINRGWTSKTRA